MTASAGRFAGDEVFPPLPLETREESKETLRRYAQVVGKVRMELTPYRSHWWHVTLYVTPRGLSTGPIPYRKESFDISFDLLDNRLVVHKSRGDGFSCPLDDEYTLAENTFHYVRDRDAVRRYGRVLVHVDQVFKQFAGRFIGKQSPVQLYWHSFDLAVTRFSGRRAPGEALEGADPVTREAYSHEVISFGFWPGDRNVRAPAFYSYTAPEPDGLTEQPLRPREASWTEQGGTALLMYDDLRGSDSPRETLLDFMKSAYFAGATTAGWDVEDLRAGAAY